MNEAVEDCQREVRRRWLWPLAPVYGAATRFRRWLAGWGFGQRRWLRSPVISVGSCSAGGAGKTPMVLLLTQILLRRGYEVSILTRGYGRRSKGVERVDPKGDARWFGDEAVLLARRSGAPVFVAENRYEAGLLAEKNEEVQKTGVHVLDDGFQHWRLGRQVDIAMLTLEDLEDELLPAGNLRESLEALRFADVIVLREEELEATAGFVAGLRNGAKGPLLWVIRRRLSFVKEWTPELADEEEMEVSEEAPVRAEVTARPLVFCGIARPSGFEKMLRRKGVEAVGMVAFADHHPYDELDMDRLVETARSAKADGFVMTEKDAVKLTGAMRAKLEEVGPVVVAKLELELVDERAAVDKMIVRVRSMERRRKA